MTRLLLSVSLLLAAGIHLPAQDLPPDHYHDALLAYKTGDYAAALTAIQAEEQALPGDTGTELLKARILAAQGDFSGGEKALRDLLKITPTDLEIQEALGDLFLKKRDYDQAATIYLQVLQVAKPPQPDVTLKLIYADVGRNNLIEAGPYLNHLEPFSQTAPAYYFAKAAISQATGQTEQADENIQTARTLYGVTVTNDYLKMYYDIFSPAKTGSDSAPSALATPAHR